MLDGFNQAKRLVRLNTSLGSKALIADGLSAQQQMSEGFTFNVSCFSETHHELSPKELVGTHATITLVQADNSYHHFNGYINRLQSLGMSKAGEVSNYSLTLCSWLDMFLGNRTDCRIFQNKTVDAVINEIFKPYGADANFKINLKHSHVEKRYWVQYNETDLNFFKRICLQEGLAYYFIHNDGSHQLHIVDSSDFLSDLSPKKVPLQSHSHDHEHLTSWQNAGQFATGNFAQTAYNYKTPSTPVSVNTTASSAVSEFPKVLEMESYLHVDDHHAFNDGQGRVSARANKAVERADIYIGTGDCRNLVLGQHFELSLAKGSRFLGGVFSDKGKTFTFSQINMTANDKTGNFNCSIEAIPKGQLIYPSADIPTINGLQTAVVTGPAGEEIHMDQEGRVKVQFHWDRLSVKDENSSCWLRVMQSFAGPNFGAHFTPRIGQEVVVAFENGKPDRPFIIGAMYHPENPPPYKNHKGTRAGIRTRTTKGGSAANCNELYFEDKKGQEEVYLQAEKDHNSVIKNDETRDVGNNQTITIGVDKSENVGNNEQHIVGKNLLIKAGSKIRLEVGGSIIEMTGGKIKVSSGHVDIDGGKVEIN